jgi:hypothetical protein
MKPLQSSVPSFFAFQKSQQCSVLTQLRLGKSTPFSCPRNQASPLTDTHESDALTAPSSQTNPFSPGSLIITSLSECQFNVLRSSQSFEIPPSESLQSAKALNLKQTITAEGHQDVVAATLASPLSTTRTHFSFVHTTHRLIPRPPGVPLP